MKYYPHYNPATATIPNNAAMPAAPIGPPIPVSMAPIAPALLVVELTVLLLAVVLLAARVELEEETSAKAIP